LVEAFTFVTVGLEMLPTIAGVGAFPRLHAL
jgi:hypothetical protein